MNTSGILLISNGYGEDSFASILLENLMAMMKQGGIDLPVYIAPLVGKGMAFHHLISAYPGSASLVFQPSERPYGGLYLGPLKERLVRMGKEFWIWGKKDLGMLCRNFKHLRSGIRYVIGVGDAIPPLANALFFRKTHFMVAVAHTCLLKRKHYPYERLGLTTAYLFRNYCHRVYTRDSQTEKWFHRLGIPASFLGFLGPNIPSSPDHGHRVLLLPGSRPDWKDNFRFLHEAVSTLPRAARSLCTFHWVFSPGLSTREISVLFATPALSCESWSQGDYLQQLGRCGLVFGFAATALEQAAFLGIPSIGPFRPDAIQVNPDFIFNRQTLLLRDSFICGGNSPRQSSQVLQETLQHLQDHQARAEQFSRATWGGVQDGGRNIARDIFAQIQEET